jgi:hypothetical protein
MGSRNRLVLAALFNHKHGFAGLPIFVGIVLCFCALYGMIEDEIILPYIQKYKN